MSERLLTAAQLARQLGLSAARVAQMKEAGMPCTSTPHGPRFSLKVAGAWYRANIARPRGGTTATACEYDVARARKAVADARLAELRLARETGQAVEIASVTRMIGLRIASCRARLLNMPAKIAPLLAAEDSADACQSIVEREVREALEELASAVFGDATTAQ